MKRRSGNLRRRGFFLLEAMLAVAIFALGVLALGRCVNNCLLGVRMQAEEARARQALANRMTEIETGAVTMKDAVTTEELKGTYEGMKLRQTRTPVRRKNEKKQDITGVFAITLEVSWENSGQPASRDLTFYVFPRR